MNEFYLFLIFACSALDAMRDGFRSTTLIGCSDWVWHWLIKKPQFYITMGFMWWYIDGFWNLVFGVILGLAGWIVGISLTPARWRSQWVKWAVILFNRVKGSKNGSK